MTETHPSTPDPAGDTAAPSSTRKRGGGLSSMLLADLKSMAAGLGIPGAGSMKKAQLVEAIKAAQSGARSGAESGAGSGAPAREPVGAEPRAAQTPRSETPASETPASETPASETAAAETPAGGESAGGRAEEQKSTDASSDRTGERQPRQRERNRAKQGQRQDGPRQDGPKQDGPKDRGPKQDGQKQDGQKQDGQKQDGQKQDGQKQDGQKQDGQKQGGQRRPDQHDGQGFHEDDDDEGGARRNRRRRGRDRTTGRAGGRNEPDTTILEDDVLVPAAGILDVLDNYAFVRTSGYLPGADDVYLSLSMVRKYGLRRGDAIVGQVRQPREGERREKFNPMVRIDSVNGADPEAARERPDFADLTPVHPQERLRLTTDGNIIGRVLDVVTPVGKGQRGLVHAPPTSGTTGLLQAVATAITTNNPECHVMVVLVDARPEEVTDFQRGVKGEVIASTFDRPPADHAMVAELSIERAKRLVELGHDVVVLLDSLTRLGRAYNLLAPANGRVLDAGVDATAVHPPKQFFGAARNIEDGGSLTVLAVMDDTGSPTDQLFVGELSGAANLELRLSRERAAQGLVPAVDPTGSMTRHEELLLAPAEAAVVRDVRRKVGEATTQGALEKVVTGR